MRRRGLSVVAVALGAVGVGAPEAAACGWLWACPDRPHAYRDPPRVYGYGGPTRSHRYWGTPVYGYRYGYGYAYLPRITFRTSRWYLGTTLPGARTDTVGLTPPITTAQGLLYSALPARGLTLFGPNAPPVAWGYAYGGYYGAPAYADTDVPSRSVPPRDTPSWWIEPRRRR